MPVNGSGDATFNKEIISFTPNVGGEYGGRYQGPKLAVKSKMDELILAGYAVKYSCDASLIATLEFSTPSNGSPGTPPSDPNADYVDNFQVFRNTMQKEVLMSDHPLVSNLTSTNLEELKNFIQEPGRWDANIGFSLGDTTSISSALYLWDLYRCGVRSVEVKQPVLRVTRITNPLYDAPFDVSRVDKLLTTATMIADSGVPSNFAVPLLNLANALQSKVTLLNGYAKRTDDLMMKFGWVKDSITCETVGKTKNQYSMEYKFGLYDVELFGEPI